MTEIKTLNIQITPELADLIAKAWLSQHIVWAERSLASPIHPDDVPEIEADLQALRRVHNYVTGESV